MPNGTLQDWELLCLERGTCEHYLALGSHHVLHSDRHRNLFLTYCFSSSLTTEQSVVPRSRGGGCNGWSVPSHGSSLLTLCTSSKHLDLPQVYHESTFCVRLYSALPFTLCLQPKNSHVVSYCCCHQCPWRTISLGSYCEPGRCPTARTLQRSCLQMTILDKVDQHSMGSFKDCF